MNNSTLRALPQPEGKSTDPLTDLLRAGARDLIAPTVEAELQALLSLSSRMVAKLWCATALPLARMAHANAQRPTLTVNVTQRVLTGQCGL